MTSRPTLAALTGLTALVAPLATALVPAEAAPGDDAAVVAGRAVPGEGAPAARRPATNPTLGSLVFVRDHDVWISRADGTGARAVTTDGDVRHAYGSPTQARNGTIAAQLGTRIVRLSPAGTVLSSIDPLPLYNSLSHPMDGTPTDVAISPDGTHVAYSFTGFECDGVAGCATRTATGVTRADVATDPEQDAVSYRNAAEWITDSRLLLGGGGGIDVHLQTLGQAEKQWFGDVDTGAGGWDFEDLAQPTLSPDGTLLAAVRGYGEGTHIFWYDVPEDPRSDADPATPVRKCTTTTLESLAAPTFSAGGVLAFAAEGDVYATQDPQDCTAPIDVLVEDADEPSFSAWTYRVPAPENTGRPAVSGSARVGRTLTAKPGSWTPRPTALGYQWLRNGKAVRGATKASYVVSRADVGRKLAVRVTARSSGGSTTATSAAVTARR